MRSNPAIDNFAAFEAAGAYPGVHEAFDLAIARSLAFDDGFVMDSCFAPTGSELRPSAHSWATALATEDVSNKEGLATDLGEPARLGSCRYRFTVYENCVDQLFEIQMRLASICDPFGYDATEIPKALTFRVLTPSTIPQISAAKGPTIAQDAIAQIKDQSGLSNEQIAPLVRVSRRSLQSWIAGERINQRNEAHLIGLRDAVRAFGAKTPEETRKRLFEVVEGRVRVIDLLAAGRFDVAVALVTGKLAARKREPIEAADNLVAQMSRLDDSVFNVEARPTGRFVGRLRR